jgi:[ribosomal protein S5]-alanine N-acetyltransferase
MSLSLKPISLEYTDDIFSSISGNVAEYFYDFKSIQETEDWIRNAVLQHKEGEKEEYVVFDDELFVGMISPKFVSDTEVTIGIWIAESQQGKGYGKQSLQLLIESLRNRGLKSIYYETEEKNLASINLARSLGFEQVDEEGGDLMFVLKIQD